MGHSAAAAAAASAASHAHAMQQREDNAAPMLNPEMLDDDGCEIRGDEPATGDGARGHCDAAAVQAAAVHVAAMSSNSTASKREMFRNTVVADGACERSIT
jgi:hypothetical protein